MFKSARRRSEKNKVKIVFKLQFHAAKVSQVEHDALMVSVVPADAGKPTVKSDKAPVRNGGCFWENPVYESVKFSRDPKSGKIHERIYYFVVGTGSSSKSGVIGEASIDFSNYGETTKVSMVSLPLKCSKMEAILNVSIQRMQESFDHREVEENENAKSNCKDYSLKAQLENGDMDETAIKTNSDDMSFNKTVSHIAEWNGARRVSSMSDITMSSSESDNVRHVWLRNLALEAASTDDSLSTSRDDEPSDAVEKLKSEVASLSRQAEMSELELQTLRKQIVKESKRGHDLFKELVCLKEERDALKGECVKIKTAKTRNTNSQFDGGDCWEIVDELRQELNHAKELNANFQIQLLKMQESNSELIIAVKDFDGREMNNNEMATKKEVGSITNDENDDDEEQKALEELVNVHGDVKEAYILEQIINMRAEIEIYKQDKDELEMQMEQLALDYEIMKQENHEMAYRLKQSEIQEQLKMQYECSSSHTTAQELEAQIEDLENELKRRSDEVSELKVHVERLEEELEKQSEGFEADLEVLMRSRVEQEQRAIRAEETLRKTKWQNVKMAEKLQEEFKRLFVQIGSTLGSNEKLAAKAMTEANELCLQKSRLEEIIKKASEEQKLVKNRYDSKIGNMQLEIEHKMLQLENQKRDEISNQALMSELEQMRISIKLMKLLLKQGDDEKIELDKELNNMRFFVDEKESLIEKMQSELDLLRTQCKELEHTVSEDALEKDVLRKQLFLFKGHLNKKNDSLDEMEKKITQVENFEKIKLLEDQIKANENGLETSYHAFLDKENELCNKIGELEGKLELLDRSSFCYCDATNCFADNTQHLDDLSNEMALLKQRNQLMEVELLEMQERYSEISVKFAEVEGEKQQLVMRVRNLKNAKKRS
ncbi:hypothetical protein CASFOL_002336 [Castilleja foliolosa]|uniref:C2 NT-type domain-containing protein n=1 Tax=Castilleja foliolosa TaxID=1961234 RepID=A0ABD3EE93_9LAMI